MKLKRAAILAFVGMALAFSSAYARGISEEVKLLTVINRTGEEVTYLFVSPDDSQHWGPDILGTEQTFANGASVGFFVHYPQACGKFDLMGSVANGASYVIDAFEVCDNRNNQRATLTPQTKSEGTENEYTTLEFKNTTAKTMRMVFVSPSDSEYWGADYLDQNTVLRAGASMKILVPVTGEAVTYNVMAADESDAQYKFDIEVSNAQDSYTFLIEESDKQQ